ncbi:MAG: hypothetical protein IJ326_07035, partial [Lachnospiraceae bacterium]|nr:hypothetical protein [Lachnospiraceae bacterium]
SAVIGQYYIEAPLLPQTEIENYMEHWGVKLVEGEMPKKENDILLSVNMMKNGSYQIGDVIEGISDYTIVGVVDGDDYFACGMDDSGAYENPAVCVLTDVRIEDMAKELHELGYHFDEEDAYIADIKSGAESLEADVTGPIEFSSRLIYVAIVCVLSILVLIVYMSYLRDRRNEWCLYSSIGFSRKAIYASVMRELVFTFCVAFIGAYLLIAVSVVVFDHTLIYEMGLRCRYLYLDLIGENICLYVVLLGILQIPIRFALYKIQTIDVMDDELNA